MTIETSSSDFEVSFARDGVDLAQAQRLRYRVFVEELGASGSSVDHGARREADAFDAIADHLILRDRARDPEDQVVGVYRLMTETQAAAAGGFSAASEYDLTPLLATGRPLLELGRSCLHRDYRGGMGMFHLWQALARHVTESGIGILFGVASFHGTNPGALAAPLSYLADRHLAPEGLRPVAVGPGAVAFPTEPPQDRRAALLQVPSLIKAYLRLGGVVGQGACVDTAFNTTDVCMVVDVDAMSPRQRALYAGGGA